jgi:hypothetical protein
MSDVARSGLSSYSGYIEYTRESHLSPEYSNPIIVNSITYPSPIAAIDAGNDAREVMLSFVA